MALCHFARCGAKAAVLEVGLGGRLDSTNVCTPAVSVITSISFDHTKQLGDTLAAIAGEKAGIIKPGVPVVSGVDADEAREVIRRIARQNGCRLIERGVDFDFAYHPPQHLEVAPALASFDFHNCDSAGATAGLPGGANGTGDEAARGTPSLALRVGINSVESYQLSLLGRHQAANAAVAVATIGELQRAGWTISEEAIRRGLAEVTWPARVEVVARRPAIVLDAAHNAASIAALMETLDESFSSPRRLLIFATTQEKDLRGMLRHLVGRFDHIIFTRYLNNPRSVPPEELQRMAVEVLREQEARHSCLANQEAGHSCLAKATDKNVRPPDVAATDKNVRPPDVAATDKNVCPPVPVATDKNVCPPGFAEIQPTPTDAWNAVRRMATSDDLIVITGSFFLAAEMRRAIADT